MSYARQQLVYRQRSNTALTWVVAAVVVVVGVGAVAGLLSLDLTSAFTLALQVP